MNDPESTPSVQPALKVGQIVGHYQIIRPLGKGGMGEVYLASDTKLDRNVALKLLPAAFTGDKERLHRFVQEARAASSLNHPNIITIHEIGQSEGAHFIATEFIEGQTLRHRMQLERMKLQDILDVSIQAGSALQAAHAAGIIHRDIKPENIMLRPDGYVKVLDFGLAKLTEKSHRSSATPASSAIETLEKHTEPGAVLGTIHYMSPEQARSQALDERTDVFSLGAVIYEMATRRMAFDGGSSADILVSILEREPPPLDQSTPEIPAEFQRIISKALRKDREERYQTIKDLLIDLKSFRDQLSFEEKLERSKPSRASTEPALSSDANGTRSGLGCTVSVTLVLGMLAALAIAPAVLWRRTATKPDASSAVRPPERALSYWITVQKYRDGKPYQDPFRLRDDINFEKDYRIRLNIISSQRGHLYLLNEGPGGIGQDATFNVLFPSETSNNGSALLTENQQVQIPQQSWLQFDSEQGTEKIWVIWAANDVPEMEAVKGFANAKDRGIISSPGLNMSLSKFLKAHSSSKPSVERNQEKKETVVRANGEMLVHAIMLEHH